MQINNPININDGGYVVPMPTFVLGRVQLRIESSNILVMLQVRAFLLIHPTPWIN